MVKCQGRQAIREEVSVDPAIAAAAVVKAGLSLLERTAPAGLGRIRSWWKGKTILVLGQARAGKSTFLDYLQHGIFEEEQDTEKTLEVAILSSMSP
jgi:putative ribosome biogenesis GTPase RsgA